MKCNGLRCSLLYAALLTVHSLIGQAPQWELAGPIGEPINRHNAQSGVGRIISIAEHPSDTNILYLGTESGGLFKRIKSSDTAELIDIFSFEKLGVSEIAINQLDPNVIYIGTGEGQGALQHYIHQDLRQSSSGIYKTSDGGTSWSQVLAWNDMLGVDARKTYQNWLQIGKILVHSVDTASVIVFVRNRVNGYQPSDQKYAGWGMIFRSSDGGATWNEIDANHDTLSNKYFWDAEVNKADPDVIYAASNKFSISTDFGLTWSDITSKLPSYNHSVAPENYMKLAVVPDGSHDSLDNWVAVLAYGGADSEKYNDLYVSKDGFATDAIRVLEINDNDVVGLGDNLTIGSTGWHPTKAAFAVNYDFSKIYTGGTTFRRYNFMDAVTPALSTVFVPNNRAHDDWKELYVPRYTGLNGGHVYGGTDGGYFVSYNSGQNWRSENDGIIATQFFSVSISERDSRILGGTQDNASMLFEDGSWYKIKGSDGDDTYINTMDPRNIYYGNYFAILDNNPVYVSSDAGTSIDATLETVSPESYKIMPIRASPDNSGKLYMGADPIPIYDRSVDPADYSGTVGFSIPKHISDNLIVDIALSEDDPSILYVSTEGYYVDTAGIWRDDTLKPPNYNWHLPNSTHRLDLFKMDLEATSGWIDISPWKEGIVGSDVFGGTFNISVSPHDKNKLWCTTKLTVSATDTRQNILYSDDGGTSWSIDTFDFSMAPRHTADIQYIYGRNDELLVAIDGKLLWRDYSGDWHIHGSGLPNGRIEAIDIDYCEGVVAVATYGSGIWTIELPNNETTDRSYNPISITGQVVWDKNRNVYSDVVVEAGAVLVIEDGAQINMAKSRKIIVERGGRLELDSAFLTNVCGEVWGGIEVWGYSSADQPTLASVLNATYPVDVDDHGVVIVRNGSIVSNAEEGILLGRNAPIGYKGSYTGGIALLYDSKFIGNAKSLHAYNYDNYDNISRINNC